MKVASHARFEILRRHLRKAPELFQPWRGAAYRVTSLDYPHPKSILEGTGSYLNGGRWNAIGSFRAVYGSTEDTVAVAESRATADYVQITVPFRIPRLLVAIELSLQAMVDLRSEKALQKLGLSLSDLVAEDWRKVQERGTESLTQAIGRAIFAHSAEGILVPSARVAGGTNVVYFPENHRAESQAAVLGADKLDRIRTD